MRTQQDYFKKVLGLSLKGRPSFKTAKKNPSPVSPLEEPFYFYADSMDLEKNKNMVDKLLKAVKRDENIFLTEESLDQIEDQKVFVFGPLLTKRKFIFYPDFSSLSEDQNLKAQLWKELQALL